MKSYSCLLKQKPYLFTSKLFMKKSFLHFLVAGIVSFIVLLLVAFTETNTGETKIIIVRHAEKDTMGGSNPGLTADGENRADRLSHSFPGITPDEFYSTNYIRTVATVKPWAKMAGKEVKLYDAKSQAAFAEIIKLETGKTIVIAGHSNTVPPLVNLILGKEKYSLLKDNEYDKIFLITINDGIIKDTVMVY